MRLFFKEAGQYPTASVIERDHQHGPRATTFKPVMMRAIHLQQVANRFTAQATFAVLFSLASPRPQTRS